MAYPKNILIIGAGPAGLTAAYEILKRDEGHGVQILESDQVVGGISRTVEYQGNRIDIGGHRFFSKSRPIMDWWRSILPVEDPDSSAPEIMDRMLVRNRLSRIYFLQKFFPYPLVISLDVMGKLGFWRMVRIATSYMRAVVFPRKDEQDLESFLIKRFGTELYTTFFKDYTEKVWGRECREISSEWGGQRIKGLSIFAVLRDAILTLVGSRNRLNTPATETSLIKSFLYPKLGPGQMWEKVAHEITVLGGKIHFGETVTKLEYDPEVDAVNSVTTRHQDGRETRYPADAVIASMPLREIISGMGDGVDKAIQEIANGLQYRDFITVGVLLSKLSPRDYDNSGRVSSRPPDHWIYIQEPDVKVGRIQVFNNWSPYMVADPDTTWLGLEYFTNAGDEIDKLSDEEIKSLAVQELVKLNFAEPEAVLDQIVIRMPKAYPAYFGSYPQIDILKDFCNRVVNLYPVGRNGMHRYNNQDHSMLSAMLAVESIMHDGAGKERIWDVNAEQHYHEDGKESK